MTPEEKTKRMRDIYKESGIKRKKVDGEVINPTRLKQCLDNFTSAEANDDKIKMLHYGTGIIALMVEKLSLVNIDDDKKLKI